MPPRFPFAWPTKTAGDDSALRKSPPPPLNPEASQQAAKAPARILVCVNHRQGASLPSCGQRGGDVLAEALAAEIGRRDLPVSVQGVFCLGHCERGPTLRFAPGGEFHLRVSHEQIPQLVDRLEFLRNQAIAKDATVT